MRRSIFPAALAALAAVCLAAPAGAQGFALPWGCTINGWPCWMAYPAAADDNKCLTYDLATRSLVFDSCGSGGGLSGLTATRVPYATGATTLGDDAGLTYTAATDTLTVVGSVATPSVAAAANADLKLFSSGTGGTLWGTVTTVGSLTACTSNGTTTIAKASHGLTLLAGDTVRVTSATTAADVGFYRLVSSTAGTLVVSRALAGSDSDVALTVYRTGMALGPNGRLYNTSTLTGSSGTMFGVAYSPQVNQSGTAGYTALYVDATQTATGSGTKRLLDLAADGTSMFSVSNAGAVTGVDSIWNKPNITTTLTSAVSLANVTPATAGTTVQQSPALRFEGHAWETAGGTDDKLEWYNFVLPVTGATASSVMYWQHSKEGAAVTTPMYLTSAGALLVAQSVTAGTHVMAGTGVMASMPTTSTTASAYAIKVAAITGANNNEVAVLDASTARTFRRAVVADTGLVVLGVKSSSWTAGMDGMYAGYVYVDNAAVAIGDTLVVSTAADGAAMTNNATTTPKLILGYATEARTVATIETYQSHTTATPGVVTVTAPTAFASNQRVVLMGGTFGGLTQGAAYFVRNPSGSKFELSLTSGGASLALTSAAATGSPTFVPTNLISFWMK